MTGPDPTPRAPERSLIHRGMGRVELFDLTAAALTDLEHTLAALAAEGRPRLSFHAPIIRPEWFPYSAVTHFYVNEAPDRRALNLRLLADTLERTGGWPVEYVVTHLTFGGADTRDSIAARRLARESCLAIAALSRETGIPIDIEFAAYTDSFHEPAQFLDAMDSLPELGVCIDIGHIFVGAALRGRDFLADLATLAPRCRSLHLWNSQGPEHSRHDPHTPLHPRQTVARGWIDMERALATIFHVRPVANIIFEYPVAHLDREIQDGYDWIEDTIRRL